MQENSRIKYISSEFRVASSELKNQIPQGRYVAFVSLLIDSSHIIIDSPLSLVQYPKKQEGTLVTGTPIEYQERKRSQKSFGERMRMFLYFLRTRRSLSPVIIIFELLETARAIISSSSLSLLTHCVIFS